MQPVIKWTGSKRSQAKEILKYFPKEISTYYEPFVGGGSVFGALLESDIKVGKFIISDLNEGLIGIWKLILENPRDLYYTYTNHWLNFNYEGVIEKVPDQKLYERRKKYFNKVKEEFNRNKAPEDLFFLTRTAFSGLIRYNSKNEYNSSCHFTRPGMQPERLESILYQWHDLLKGKNIEFKLADYTEILAEITDKDTVYMDPPYLHTTGIYYGDITFNDFWNNVQAIKGNWLVSYNGYVEGQENSVEVPKIYSKAVDIYTGESSFRKLKNKGSNGIYERLYIK